MKDKSGLIEELYDELDTAYGWVCNFPETDPDITASKLTVSRRIGELLYSDPRLEEIRAEKRRVLGEQLEAE